MATAHHAHGILSNVNTDRDESTKFAFKQNNSKNVHGFKI